MSKNLSLNDLNSLTNYLQEYYILAVIKGTDTPELSDLRLWTFVIQKWDINNTPELENDDILLGLFQEMEIKIEQKIIKSYQELESKIEQKIINLRQEITIDISNELKKIFKQESTVKKARNSRGRKRYEDLKFNPLKFLEENQDIKQLKAKISELDNSEIKKMLTLYGIKKFSKIKSPNEEQRQEMIDEIIIYAKSNFSHGDTYSFLSDSKTENVKDQEEKTTVKDKNKEDNS